MTELLSLSTIVKAKDTVMIESKLHPKGRSYDLIGLDDLGPFEYQKILDRTAAADKLGVIEQADRGAGARVGQGARGHPEDRRAEHRTFGGDSVEQLPAGDDRGYLDCLAHDGAHGLGER